MKKYKYFFTLSLFFAVLNSSANLQVSDKPVMVNGLDGSVPDIYECGKEKHCLSLVGEIQPGDYDRLKPIIEQAVKDFYLEKRASYSKAMASLLDDKDSGFIQSRSFSIMLDSPGGNVNEAIKLSKFLRSLGVATTVPLGKKCLSSCFYLYAAGNLRIAFSEDSLGIHTPYFKKEFFNELTQEEADLLYLGKVENSLNELSKLFIPSELIEIARNTPSNQIYYLNFNEISNIAINRVHNERILSLCSAMIINEDLPCSSDATSYAFSILQLKTIDDYFGDEFKDRNNLAYALRESVWLESILMNLFARVIPIPPEKEIANKSLEEQFSYYFNELSLEEQELFLKINTLWYKKIYDYRSTYAVLNSDEALSDVANRASLSKADAKERLKLVFIYSSPLENIWEE